ncbi:MULTISPECIES: tRNA pseudouridine(55) synthase TruB [Thalassolituus]|uniref:tRNA pseudouridine(55) synthase TruB n=1 Tax=Thalassolituus TaxID=187492 RepID=UPI000C5E53C6|nr:MULTISPECIES: tRNA pseudouridine(55) synthase TruB [Thalassolituus]MAX85490.1 tRNA pseudouridine(55) synthase TruB [Oceanospirillaceae bacterium]MEE3159743.1 tRNA pseudouridine(55) synthase TruB [Pseudomonadota bacterium]|tara:strand:+ start:37825 stop:38790 length:966 start_codon:yes stop_codon:yes gene_type:complete
MARRKKGRDISGILVVNKPLGLSSNQVLQRVKRLYNANKAGHTGALDPEATGVLPICLGEATKFSQLLLDSDKGYDTRGVLGQVRSTGDKEGEILQERPVPELNTETIETVLSRFRGDVEQVPPMFSALKMDGKPLYELARQGMSQEEMRAVAEKKRRVIRIHELTLSSYTPDSLSLSVRCSKGTYIRTLVEDIGEALGCGAFVQDLHRTHSGPYDEAMSHTLEELEQIVEQGGEDKGALDALLMPPETALPETWPEVSLTLAEAARLLQGQAIKTGLTDNPSVQLWAVESGVRILLGIGRVENGAIRSQRLMQVSLPDLA